MTFYIAARILLYALAAIAAATAAGKLGWWEGYVARAWTLFSLEFLFLLVNYILRQTTPGAALALDATLIAANVFQATAYWMMARVLAAAGIGYPLSGPRRALVAVAALGVAILLCNASLQAQWHLLRAGDVRPGALISVLTDVVTFTLIAPLATSALVLRGGMLSWTFGLLTVSVIGWMLNTGATSLTGVLGGGDDLLRAIRFAGVAVAALSNAAAATAQTLATIHAMEGSRAGG